MKKRPVLWVVMAANLAALLALAFVHPDLMVSAGPLRKAHAELATDCFACHAPGRGASAQRCVACHAVADIGRKTPAGTPIAGRPGRVAFHQGLIEQDCLACHVEHQGAALARRGRNVFSHELLAAPVRAACSSCHAAPKDAAHQAITTRTECSRCHGPAAWQPATFDHDASFVLDRDHQAPCDTCHVRGGERRYTCYGCHEHSQARVRAEHIEEGIVDFENCVECHRDPRAEPESGRGRTGGGRDQEARGGPPAGRSRR